MKVSAYRNLRKPGVTFSIKHKSKVIDWRQNVVLTDASFKHPGANALGRIRAGHREVCAWVKGDLGEFSELPNSAKRVLCDPRKHDYFLDADTKEPLHDTYTIYLTAKGCFYV